MDKKIVAIALLAAIIITGSSAAILLTRDDGSSDGVTEPGRALVYGNANNDDYLDERDVEAINKIIDGDELWDKVKYPFADTNADGRITEDDVTLLKKFINNEDCLMYYKDTWGTTSYVHYPLKGKIGVMDWRQSDLAVCLNIWDDVVACGTAGMNDIKHPGFSDKAIYGSGYYVDAETVMQSGKDLGVTCLLAYTGSDGTAQEVKNALLKSGSNIDVIAVDRTDLRVMTMTTATLIGKTTEGHAYVDYCDKLLKQTEDALMTIDADQAKSVLIVQVYKTTTTDNISVMVNSPSPHPLYELLHNHTLTYVVTPIEYGSGWYSVTDAEWILDQDPDYIVFTVASSLWSKGDKDDAQIQAEFEDYCKTLFGQTTAYKNGNIIATDHSAFGGQMCYLVGYKVLSMIYPELISAESGDEALNAWWDLDFGNGSLEQFPQNKVRILSDKN